MQTHDYNTLQIHASGLDNTCVLVGESGGLSAVYTVTECDPMPVHGGLTSAVKVDTEHGTMYMPSNTNVTVLVD
jgi:hypothetical protein